MTACLLWKVLLVVLLAVGPARAITLDLTEVVMRGPLGSSTDDGDHFGYSAALHNKMEFSATSTFADIVDNAR